MRGRVMVFEDGRVINLHSDEFVVKGSMRFDYNVPAKHDIKQTV